MSELVNWEYQANDAAWLPSECTPTLTGNDEFYSDGARLIRVIEKYWRTKESNQPVRLDRWQKWLILRLLETYPPDWPVIERRNQLRFRQSVVSLGRQNGKSFLASVLGWYGLKMMKRGATVLGLASTAEQATIIYERVVYAINNEPKFSAIAKTTRSRGVALKDGTAKYIIKPAKEDALQGIEVNLCLFDELHICPPEMWNAVVNGMRAQDTAMVLGITTAGDENSSLLKALYATGQDSVAGAAERFGFWLWEAPTGSRTDDAEAIKAANPAVAEGRIPVERVLEDTKSEPEHKNRRFVLNQFTASENPWISPSKWYALESGWIPDAKELRNAYVTVSRTERWEHASIAISVKRGDKVYTRLIKSFVKPKIETLEAACLALQKSIRPAMFVMESPMLKDLAERLRNKGIACEYLTQAQMTNVCATAYSMIMNNRVVHNNDQLVNNQMTRGVVKNIGDQWRIDREKSTGEVDSLLATVMGIWAAEVKKTNRPFIAV